MCTHTHACACVKIGWGIKCGNSILVKNVPGEGTIPVKDQ